MLIRDPSVQARDRQGLTKESNLQKVQDNLDRHTRMAAVLKNRDLVPPIDACSNDPRAWIGQSLKIEDFERRLRKLRPNFIFASGGQGKFYPGGPFRSVLIRLPDGALQATGVCYQNQPQLPEFSIPERLVQDTPDATTQHVRRADLPKHEFNWETKSWDVDTSKPRPGYVRQEICWGERIRGWRTVLLRLHSEGFITLGDVVREFGAVDRLGWAAHTGALNVQSPY